MHRAGVYTVTYEDSSILMLTPLTDADAQTAFYSTLAASRTLRTNPSKLRIRSVSFKNASLR